MSRIAESSVVNETLGDHRSRELNGSPVGRTLVEHAGAKKSSIKWRLLGSLMLVAAVVGGAFWTFFYFHKRSRKMRQFLDRVQLKFPIIGPILVKSAIARYARTLSTMFAAGVPLVEALESVAGARIWPMPTPVTNEMAMTTKTLLDASSSTISAIDSASRPRPVAITRRPP